MAEDVYIISGARTPIGNFLGSLAYVTAPELGAIAVRAAVERAGVNADKIDELYMGAVVTAGIGQAPARQAAIKAGLPLSVGATTIGKVCGSGMKAVMLGRSEIMAGEAEVVVTGGMESMSQTPHLLRGMRKGVKMGHQQIQDAMIIDGLWDPYSDRHMGNCGELCAAKYGFSREDQDKVALASYQRALQSIANGVFREEIVPVTYSLPKGEPVTVSEDEGPKRLDINRISQLPPAFEKTGTITAGNASSINDGGAAMVLASERATSEQGLTPMARIIATSTCSQDPSWFSTAPVEAIARVLKKADLTDKDIDLYEINEAFAVVPMAAIHDLKLESEKVNVRGSGISLGHPIGATGARILITLMYALKQMKKRYGLASLCIGGGEATAVIIENLLL